MMFEQMIHNQVAKGHEIYEQMKAEGRIKEKADIGIRINPQVYLFQEKMKEIAGCGQYFDDLHGYSYFQVWRSYSSIQAAGMLTAMCWIGNRSWIPINPGQN